MTPLLKLRRFFQFTLPAELRKQFPPAEGDDIEAEAVEEGILFKPIRVVERKKAWEGVGKVRTGCIRSCLPTRNALRRMRSRRSSKTIAHDMSHGILDARGLVTAFLTPKGVSDERLRHGWRGAFVLCLSERDP